MRDRRPWGQTKSTASLEKGGEIKESKSPWGSSSDLHAASEEGRSWPMTEKREEGRVDLCQEGGGRGEG